MRDEKGERLRESHTAKKVRPRRGLGARGLTHKFFGKTAPSYLKVQPVHAQNGDEDSELIVRACVMMFLPM